MSKSEICKFRSGLQSKDPCAIVLFVAHIAPSRGLSSKGVKARGDHGNFLVQRVMTSLCIRIGLVVLMAAEALCGASPVLPVLSVREPGKSYEECLLASAAPISRVYSIVQDSIGVNRARAAESRTAYHIRKSRYLKLMRRDGLADSR